jgi:hypothetical protein
MLFGKFFKFQKPKGFDFQPRFYNAEEADFKRRVKDAEIRAEAEKQNTQKNVDTEGYTSRISQAFQNKPKPKSPLLNFSSNVAFLRLIIIFLLLVATYLYLELGSAVWGLFRQKSTAFLGLLALIVVYFGIKFRARKR